MPPTRPMRTPTGPAYIGGRWVTITGGWTGRTGTTTVRTGGSGSRITSTFFTSTGVEICAGVWFIGASSAFFGRLGVVGVAQLFATTADAAEATTAGAMLGL